MSKPLLGLVLGAVLGLIDGASAWFYGPEIQAYIASIVFFSMLKGLLTGWIAGVLAKRVSVPLALVLGLSVGLLLSFAVASFPGENGQHYYWEIMLPGGLLGLIVAFVAQRYGRSAPASRSARVP